MYTWEIVNTLLDVWGW